MWPEIAEQLKAETGVSWNLDTRESVSGGCINQAWRIRGTSEDLFLKVNEARLADMFRAEFGALQAIRATDTVRVPEPVALGITGSHAWIAMEYIVFGRASAGAQRTLGRQLAELHRHTKERFGWEVDNTIGETTQFNGWMDDWIEFYRERRLRPQIGWARERGLALKGADELVERMSGLFSAYTPAASLLHGDLWGGNVAADPEGQPVIFDPATYYGDRETDLAFTEMFGGFSREFYDAYNDVWPLDEGYGQRKSLYNLYHTLNHFNLFGGGYGHSAEGMVSQLLRSMGS